MIRNVDDLIYAEMLFENQEVKDISYIQYSLAVKTIVEMLKSGRTLKQVKRYINSLYVNEDLEETLTTHANQQATHIEEENSIINPSTILFAGYTIKELIKLRKNTTKNKLIKTMSKVNIALKEKTSINNIISNETSKYRKELESFIKTQAKQAREHSYVKVELKYHKQISGWVSIAILDNRTSSTCLFYHNKFYSSQEYKTRFDIPNPPPRHPNCRSILVPVWTDTDPNDYRLDNINDFLRQNENLTREILGKKKAEIYLTGKTPINKFIDITNNRYFTNDQIMKKLKIKSKNRLRKIQNVNKKYKE